MTPVYKINIPNANVWAKVESVNPTGTHKDRSMGPWIEHYAGQGIKKFAIASSGNAALSAAKYCAENKLTLNVFVSKNSYAVAALFRKISTGSDPVDMRISKNPRKAAIDFCKKNKGVINLRSSRDDKALLGYQKIAQELIRQFPNGVDNIFIPTSSGATLVGIYGGFSRTGSPNQPLRSATGQADPKMLTPAFFVIQTAKVHPMASYFDKDFQPEKQSHASAIVDMIAHRRDEVIKICQKTNGGGFVISNAELERAREILRGLTPRGELDPASLSAGAQSALAFAGFLKWQRENPGRAERETSLCLFTD